jgi:hypothetical protein
MIEIVPCGVGGLPKRCRAAFLATTRQVWKPALPTSLDSPLFILQTSQAVEHLLVGLHLICF